MKTTHGIFLSMVLLWACGDDGGPDPQQACDPGQAGTICTITGNGQNGYDGDVPIDGLEARMSLPQDMLQASDGTLFILDWNNHRIRKIGDDGILRHVAGRGELGGTLDDPANSDLNHPTGLLLSPDQTTLYVSAWHNSKIRSVNLATGEIADQCGDGRRAYFGDETMGVTATLDLPSSIVFDPSGNLVIMDQANQVIRMVDSSGIIHRIAGICVTDQTVPCTAAPVQCPGGSGKFTCGDPATECGKPCNPGYSVGTNALDFRMAQPFGQSADPGGRMVYDKAGNLYFADTSNHLIRRLTTDGKVELVAGTEPIDGMTQKGTSPDGTPAIGAKLFRPTDLALAADGTLYFSDVYNHCIRKVATDGKIYTVAGQCGMKGFSGDGDSPVKALLKLPYGIELAGSQLYIADTGNNRIRVVNLE